MEEIKNIILISLFCLGWHETLKKGMIFGKLGDYIRRLPFWVAKPLGVCIACSASIIGSIAYLLVMRGNYNISSYIIYITSAVFLNSMLGLFYGLTGEAIRFLNTENEIKAIEIDIKRHKEAVDKHKEFIANKHNVCLNCSDNSQ